MRRLGPLEAQVLDVLSLGLEIEVLAPPALRDRVAELAEAVNGIYHRQ